jgi:hypothetical protein
MPLPKNTQKAKDFLVSSEGTTGYLLFEEMTLAVLVDIAEILETKLNTIQEQLDP